MDTNATTAQPLSIMPDYKEVLTEVIKKQMIILGPDITIAKVKGIPGVVVSDDGTISDVAGDPKQITKEMEEAFTDLAGSVVKKIMEPLINFGLHESQVTTSTGSAPTSPTINPMVDSQAQPDVMSSSQMSTSADGTKMDGTPIPPVTPDPATQQAFTPGLQTTPSPAPTDTANTPPTQQPVSDNPKESSAVDTSTSPFSTPPASVSSDTSSQTMQTPMQPTTPQETPKA